MLVACYNIKNLSSKRLNLHPSLCTDIINVINHFDITFILEVCDNDVLNKICENNNVLTGYILSTKHGITPSIAEYIGVIYKKDKINIKDIKTLKIDLSTFSFSRNPFVVQMNILKKKFVFVINHISISRIDPDDKSNTDTYVYNDLTELKKLYEFLNKKYKYIILMGDYNADKPFLKKKHKTLLDDETDNLICLTNNEITNFGKEKKLYDRVLCSDDCLPYLEEIDEEIDINLDNQYNKYCDVMITSETISDHKPIYINFIKSKNLKRKFKDI
jgi:endonuclease/exonuclease/phosphatase family metal-dependent hydrolase